MRAKIISVGLLGLALSASALGQTERQCEDEQQHAKAWIRWAVEKRAACLTRAESQDAHLRCLQGVRQELARLEQEYVRVYSDQIRTLPPDHPVVKNLIAKLQNNVQVAEAAIATTSEPEQLAALRKEICLTQR
jgi:hypothetical protein